MKLVIKELDRSWKDPKEKSYKAISFSISGRKGEIYLTEDQDYERSFDVHPIECGELKEFEFEFLVKAVCSFIQPGSYITTCGESWKEKEKLFEYLQKISLKIEETGCIRVLNDKEGKKHYYQIYKKL